MPSHDYILMTRTEDADLQNLPTLQFVDTDCPDHWLRLRGTDLMRREKAAGVKMQVAKRYRITIEELPAT